MAYAELLCRSNYSFLRGASHPEELVEAAQSLGLQALAIADLNGVYGLPKAYQKARQLEGFHLIYGAELSLQGGAQLGLLARDRAGWALLCRLLSASHAGQPKGRACLGWDEFARLVESSPGRASLLALPRGAGLSERFGADEDFAYSRIRDLLGDSVCLPLALHLDGHDARRLAAIKALEERWRFQAVACNDAHYHQAARQDLQDALVCVREKCSLAEAGFRLFANAEHRLKSEDELRWLFRGQPELVDRSAELAELCRFSLAELRYRYPSEWIPAGQDAQTYLDQLAWAGAGRRYPSRIPEKVTAQLRHELDLVGRLGFADYFLTIYEMVDFARARRILCQGRGSAANSALCYCLGITAIDPVQGGLLFERFISEERAEPPDIDVDFEHERREEVIQHLYEKYGRDRAAMVSAVISYRSRSAIAELSKALGAQQRAGQHMRDLELKDYGQAIESLGAELKGFPRHLSIHSGGFVLSGEPLIDFVPIEPARMPGRSIIQWDKYDLDYVGLMKVDVLALGMLSALRKSMDLVGYEELADIPREDPATYEMIQQGDTIGVFQIESRAQMNMLGRLKPENFYDLVIEVAIVRPGPIVGKMVHPYLKRRRGQEPVTYEHPALERILGKTLGVPLFQEQVMRIAMELAGFSPGQADELRRAIGAWRSDGRLDAVRNRLTQGLRAAGLREDFIQRLYQQIEGFAHYGFPESHAASFALLCYASSYLKRHHPAEFCCALLNSQPMGFYAPHSLIEDARHHGVRVLPLHPQLSAWEHQMQEGALRLGWSGTRGLGQEAAERLLAERQARPFASLDDFVKRCGLGPGVLRRLALGGAFECFGLEPRAALWRLLALEAFGSRGLASRSLVRQGLEAKAQMGLWEQLDLASVEAAFAPQGAFEAVSAQFSAYGASTLGHPMAALRPLLPASKARLAIEARQAEPNSRFCCAGLMITRQRPGNGKVIFATLEDESGLLDMALFEDVYRRYRDEFLEHSFFEVEGILQKDGDSRSLLLKRLKPLLPGEPVRAPSHDWR